MQKLKLILPLLVSLLAVSCASGIKDIRISSVNVASASIQGLGTIVLDVELGVYNPTVAFDIETLHGVVKYKGKDLLYADASDISIDRKSDKVYLVPLRCRAASGTNLLPLLAEFDRDTFSTDLTLDVTADVKAGFGYGKVFEYKDIPIGNYFDRK